jgi:hypothetical protein
MCRETKKDGCHSFRIPPPAQGKSLYTRIARKRGLECLQLNHIVIPALCAQIQIRKELRVS